MSLEELGEIEYHDAMERQAKEQALEHERANEDPESEKVLERERLRQIGKDEFADWNPKGKGNTKRMWMT